MTFTTLVLFLLLLVIESAQSLCSQGFLTTQLKTQMISTTINNNDNNQNNYCLSLSHLRTSIQMTSVSKEEGKFLQVITDVDDTLKSSGGVKVGDIALGGIDVQYQRGQFYPGVFQFMLELSSGIVPPKVAVLTARAEELKIALELKEDSKLAKAFRQTGENAGIDNWGLGPVLYGSVVEWVIQDRKGLRKFSNFEKLIEQDPSRVLMRYIYVGDTGELDQEAGETMLREYPQLVKAVFLHVVSEQPNPRIPPLKFINGRPVVFFRTYVGAAAKACQLGLLTTKQMMKIVDVAQSDLDDVSKSSSKWIDLLHDVDIAYRIRGR